LSTDLQGRVLLKQGHFPQIHLLSHDSKAEKNSSALKCTYRHFCARLPSLVI